MYKEAWITNYNGTLKPNGKSKPVGKFESIIPDPEPDLLYAYYYLRFQELDVPRETVTLTH